MDDIQQLLFFCVVQTEKMVEMSVIKWHGQCTKIETFQGETFLYFNDHFVGAFWPPVEKCNFQVWLKNFCRRFRVT